MSDRINLRVPDELHKKIKLKAVADGVGLADLGSRMLIEAFGEYSTSVQLPPKLYEDLKRYAENTKEGVQALVSRCVESFLKSIDKSPQPEIQYLQSPVGDPPSTAGTFTALELRIRDLVSELQGDADSDSFNAALDSVLTVIEFQFRAIREFQQSGAVPQRGNAPGNPVPEPTMPVDRPAPRKPRRKTG